MPLKVSNIGEKELIKRILKKSSSKAIDNSFFDNKALKSLSDDAALINFGDNYLVATSDILFKSAHFPDEMTYKQMGKKVVTVNISDLAAMGAKPIGIIIAIGLPKNMLVDDFDNLIDGVLEGCCEYEMMLIGGDTNESSELTVSGTCLGIVAKDNVMMKEGAYPGDIVAVTGSLGLAAAGFEILFNPKIELKDFSEDDKKIALKNALKPEAKSKEGISLAKSGFVTSCTDITDGLASEIGEIVNANDIGITIYEDNIPINDVVSKIAKKTGKNPLEFALYYGEDFELLLTVEKDVFKQISSEIPLYKIGEVTSTGEMLIVKSEGGVEKLEPRGYEHLRE